MGTEQGALQRCKRHNAGEHRDKNTEPQVGGIMWMSTYGPAIDKVLSTDEQNSSACFCRVYIVAAERIDKDLQYKWINGLLAQCFPECNPSGMSIKFYSLKNARQI